jgi:succinate dehydrogenase / fumarate reductase cytochrome b subunit
MWLFNSSVGRKVVMSVTGIALILFLTFHCAMNIIALFSGEAYNTICELLGANWYAVVATLGLAALAVVHIVYAFILTAQNRRARGAERYAVTDKPAKVEWASQNMLVLGIIILLGLILHLFNFWYNMMFAELFHIATAIPPTDGFELIKVTFANPVYVVLYVIWLVAIWLHLTHGFWSAMQTLGVSGKVWFCRWKVIGFIYTTLLMLGFLVVVLAFAFKCAPSLCCKGNPECVKAQTECVMGAHCDKADADCCKMTPSCKCEECKCDPCKCAAEKACKCEECKCDPCKCAEKTGCTCEECKCTDCKC